MDIQGRESTKDFNKKTSGKRCRDSATYMIYEAQINEIVTIPQKKYMNKKM